jgi:sugar (pentulose or hexulose) kinase
MQAVATGALSSIAELRRVVRDSTPAEAFAPRREHAREWERAYERYQELKRSRGTR